MRGLRSHLATFDSISSPGISVAVLHSLTEHAPSVYYPTSEYNCSENESVSSGIASLYLAATKPKSEILMLNTHLHGTLDVFELRFRFFPAVEHCILCP